MLVKWVRCEVLDQAGFDHGQLAWAGLRDVPGFLGQRGGWDGDGSAHVVGLWSDATTYDRFMTTEHDALASSQRDIVGAIAVWVFDRCMAIGHNLTEAPGGGVLRVAYCRVYPERTAHFVQVQSGVWNPGMSGAPGFLAGAFGQRGEHEFLVVTQWESPSAHENYLRDRFPDLRARAEASRDLEVIMGHVIQLDSRWSVSPHA